MPQPLHKLGVVSGQQGALLRVSPANQLQVKGLRGLGQIEQVPVQGPGDLPATALLDRILHGQAGQGGAVLGRRGDHPPDQLRGDQGARPVMDRHQIRFLWQGQQAGAHRLAALIPTRADLAQLAQPVGLQQGPGLLHPPGGQHQHQRGDRLAALEGLQGAHHHGHSTHREELLGLWAAKTFALSGGHHQGATMHAPS